MLVNELKRQDVLVINNNQTVNMSENDFNDKSSKKSKKKNRKNKNKKGQEMGFPKSGSQIVQSVDKAVEPVDPKEKEEEEKVEADSRFYMLTKIDHEMKRYRKPIYDNEISLEEVCESFRNFSSCQLGLYYDIKDIRRFIAGLAVTHLMILQGMSGTGKTSLAYAFGEYLDNKTTVVPIQPMWKERTDLIGYYNEFTRTSKSLFDGIWNSCFRVLSKNQSQQNILLRLAIRQPEIISGNTQSDRRISVKIRILIFQRSKQ